MIDTAKAIAAVRGGRVAAIPTTLSGAEMTRIHKLPDGHKADRMSRPVLVIADPDVMTAQPDRERRASAMNALAHAADSLYTPMAQPLSRLAALEASRLIAVGIEARRARDLAYGSLLAGYAIDSALFSLHHVICQSLVRILRIPTPRRTRRSCRARWRRSSRRAPREMAELAGSLEHRHARAGGEGGGPFGGPRGRSARSEPTARSSTRPSTRSRRGGSSSSRPTLPIGTSSGESSSPPGNHARSGV